MVLGNSKEIIKEVVGQFWMNLFADMANCIGETIVCGTFLHKIFVQICFMDIIQKELDNFVEIWNTHTISGGKGMHGENRPITFYTLPELYNKQRCLCYANEAGARFSKRPTSRRKLSPD